MSLYKVKRKIIREVKGLLDPQVKSIKKDIISYAEKLKREESYDTYITKRPVTHTCIIFSTIHAFFTMRLESLIARKLRKDYGFRVIIVTTVDKEFLSTHIHQKVYGLHERIFLEDFIDLFESRDIKEYGNICLRVKSFKEIEDVTYKNTKVGLHALATVANSTLTGEMTFDTGVLKKIAQSVKFSCKHVDAVEKIINVYNPKLIIAVEKGFSGLCEFFYEAIHRGIDYIQLVGSVEPNKIILKRYNPENYRIHPNSVSVKSFSNIAYRDEFESVVIDSMRKNYQNGNIYIYKSHKLESKPIVSREEMVNLLQIDGSKKTAIIFSHVLNDANFFYGQDLFEGGFKEWLVKTIEVASSNVEVNWILKLHPANAIKRTTMGYTGEYAEIVAIKEHMGNIPKNVTIIKPENIDLNPYSFFHLADYGITVRGTVGIELPCFGIPVLTAGTGRYSQMGFTKDFESKEAYLEKIKTIQEIPPLTKEQRQLAIKYAYIFFKLRPANCATFLKETYPYKLPHPGFRDFDIIDPDYWNNYELNNIAGFIVNSKDEDYLSNYNYALQEVGHS